ncbi:hypothetical protein TWF281_011764 [Arthrobotrys megalospora]
MKTPTFILATILTTAVTITAVPLAAPSEVEPPFNPILEDLSPCFARCVDKLLPSVGCAITNGLDDGSIVSCMCKKDKQAKIRDQVDQCAKENGCSDHEIKDSKKTLKLLCKFSWFLNPVTDVVEALIG